MQVSIFKPEIKFQDHIQKITVFRSKKKLIYQQKLTASPFSCLSYNHYDIPVFEVNGKKSIAESKLQLTGPKINDNIHALHHGRLSQVLFELKPTSFYYLFHRSPIEIINQTCALSRFIPKAKSEEFIHFLSGVNNYRSHIKKLYNILEEYIAKSLPPVDFVENAIKLIERSSGNISVNAICDQINKSERQFNRKFSEIVGIPPIQYIKIRQLHFIINLIHLKQYKFMKEIAYDTGFYDPAHFSKNFKRLTGMSPEVFIKSEEHIALGYFSELT